MRFIDKLIITLSILALFTEDFYFQYGIQWKLFYILLVFIFLFLLFKKKLVLHKNFIIIIGFLLLHGVVMFIVLKNPIKTFVAQLSGIIISSTVYYSLLKTYGTERLFNMYLKIAFYLALLAIPMFFFKINISDNRLNGIMREPAHYVAIMLPALYVLLREKKYFKFAVILFTFILAKSAVGYLGLLLIIIIPLLKIKHILKYTIALAIIILGSIFFLKSQWNKKYEDGKENMVIVKIKQTIESIKAGKTGKFENNTNLSTYALLSNTYITTQNIMEHPLGSGIGSYTYQYDKYYKKMEPPNYLLVLKQSKINKEDANSFILRMISDLGVFSLFFLFFFIYISIKVFKRKNYYRQGSFFYLILKLLREGHYFPPEFYFFLLVFLKDFYEDTTHS